MIRHDMIYGMIFIYLLQLSFQPVAMVCKLVQK